MTREEAIKKIKEAMPTLWKETKEAIQVLIPEFAESDDERIRKEMIRYFTEMKKGGSASLPYDDCIAYLESKGSGIKWFKSDNVKNPDKPYIDKAGMFYTTDSRMCYASEIEKQKEDEGYEVIPVESTLEYKLGFKAGKESEKQKDQKPKMTPKWLFRLEFKDSSCGLWYDGTGKWCFESGIGSISGCKTKTLPMDYDARYKQDGRDWFSSCSRKEDLMHWYSLEDAKELISKGFVFTRYLATEYHEYDQQTVFIKESALCREEIDIFELFEQQKSALSEEDEIMIGSLINYFEGDALDCSLDSVVNWLKSLRPQPKQEWSEEDDTMLKDIIAGTEATKQNLYAHDPQGRAQMQARIDWLKSLRPPLKDREMKLKILKYLSTRCSSLEFEEVEDYLNNLRPSWKPSKGQMTALKLSFEDVFDDVGYCSRFADLKSLYEQLKKLI